MIRVLLNLITFASARLLINSPSGEVIEVMLLLLLLSTWKIVCMEKLLMTFSGCYMLLHAALFGFISLFLKVNLQRTTGTKLFLGAAL